jgi:hypothetical protein
MLTFILALALQGSGYDVMVMVEDRLLDVAQLVAQRMSNRRITHRRWSLRFGRFLALRLVQGCASSTASTRFDRHAP